MDASSKTERLSLKQRFEAFHVRHPEVWELFVRFSLEINWSSRQLRFILEAALQSTHWQKAGLFVVTENMARPADASVRGFNAVEPYDRVLFRVRRQYTGETQGYLWLTHNHSGQQRRVLTDGRTEVWEGEAQ